MHETHIYSWRKWLRQVGVSPVTGYRWRRRGWITPLNVAGKLYVTAAEVARFERRATAGEFAQSARCPGTHPPRPMV
jgi:predicted site-specific integrase-resolvase